MSLYYNQMIEDLLNDNELRIYKDKESDLQWEIKDYGTTLVCQQYFPDHSGYYNELLDMNVYYDLDMKQEKSFDILIDLLNKYKDRVLPMYLYAGEGEAEFLHIPYEEASKYDSFKKLTYIAEIFPYVFKVKHNDPEYSLIELTYSIKIQKYVFHITIKLYDFNEFTYFDKGKLKLHPNLHIVTHEETYYTYMYMVTYTIEALINTLNMIKDNR